MHGRVEDTSAQKHIREANVKEVYNEPNVVEGVDWFYVVDNVHDVSHSAQDDGGLFERHPWGNGVAGSVMTLVPSLYPDHFSWGPQVVIFTETMQGGTISWGFSASVISGPTTVGWIPDRITGVVPLVEGVEIGFGYDLVGGRWQFRTTEGDHSVYDWPGVRMMIKDRFDRIIDWIRREEERRHAGIGVLTVDAWLAMGAPALLSDWEA